MAPNWSTLTTLQLNSPQSNLSLNLPARRRHAAIARKVHHAVKHSRFVRMGIFVGAIAVSVFLIQALHLHEEHKQAAQGFMFSLSAFLDRGLEVLTDCVCDRFFPEGN